MANRTTNSLVHMSVFPQNFEFYKKFAFTENLTPTELQNWKKNYLKVIKKTYFINKKKPLILKSPDNTCHSKALSEMFPTSKFICIYRNPYKVICSFKHTITKMMEHFSLQELPSENQIEDFVIAIYKKTMEQYKKDKIHFADRLIEIKYEDFIKSPLAYLQKIYDKLDLPNFEKNQKNFENFLESQKNYQTNQYELDEHFKLKIQKNLQEIFEDYGYELWNFAFFIYLQEKFCKKWKIFAKKVYKIKKMWYDRIKKIKL